MKNSIEKIGAGYIRVSTDDQTEYSPTSQIKLIKKYAKENNITLLNDYIFQEDGISGKSADKRPEFQRMIAIAKSKDCPFNVILVYDFSRFARNKNESVMYKTLLRKKLGIDVISITQPLSDRKESVILESMYEAMDEYYSLNLSENVIRGKIEKASRGEFQGNPPYGYIYNKNTKSLEIDKNRADIVRFIFNEWNSPEMTIRRLAVKLNDMGVKTTRGKLWTDRNLHIIIRNPAYIGYIRFTPGGMKRNWNDPNMKIIKANHEAIITQEVWNMAQRKMEVHDKTYFRYMKPAPKNEHWLRGLLKCSDCGTNLYKRKVHDRPAVFECGWVVKGRCKYSHYVRESVIVNAILEQLKKDYTEKLNINICMTSQGDSEIDIAYKQLDKLKKKEKRIKDAYLNEIDSLEEYKENKKNLAEEMQKLNEEINKLKLKNATNQRKEKIFKFSEEAYKLLSDKNVDEQIKYQVSHQLFEKIVYNKKENSIEITYK